MFDARMTGRRKGLRWFTCAVCDLNYPEDRVVQQKGRVVCTGSETKNCADQYGADHYRRDLQVPYERTPEDPPEVPWEDI